MSIERLQERNKDFELKVDRLMDDKMALLDLLKDKDNEIRIFKDEIRMSKVVRPVIQPEKVS